MSRARGSRRRNCSMPLSPTRTSRARSCRTTASIPDRAQATCVALIAARVSINCCTNIGRSHMTIRSQHSMRLALAGSVACTALALGLYAPATAADVTYERLLNASKEPQNWLMRMGNYGNWNHSTLSDINRNNVGNLNVKFMFSLGDPTRPAKATQYFTPIVEDGFLYVRNQYHQYWKLDVRSEER